LLSGIENEIVKEHYLKKLSSELDVSLESIIRQIDKIQRVPFGQPAPEKIIKKRRRIDVLEEYLLALVLQYTSPHSIYKEIQKILINVQFETTSIQQILIELDAYAQKHSTFDSREFAVTLPKELLHTFDTSYLFPLSKFETDEIYKKEAIKIAQELKILYIKSKIKVIGETIKREENEESEQRLEQLQKELAQLTHSLQG